MRILVCGSRDYPQQFYHLIKEAIEGATLVIEGGANGADAWAKRAANELRIPVVTFKADWARLGLDAGPIRNQKMLDEGKPDLVLAFTVDSEPSPGTADMIRRAKEAGIPGVHCWVHPIKESF